MAMSLCDVCKRRWRNVTILDSRVLCMSCLAQMLNGALIAVRGESGDRFAVLTDERRLRIGTKAELVNVMSGAALQAGAGVSTVNSGLTKLDKEPGSEIAEVPRRSPGRPRKIRPETAVVS